MRLRLGLFAALTLLAALLACPVHLERRCGADPQRRA